MVQVSAETPRIQGKLWTTGGLVESDWINGEN
jgi:hypothetical protein